MKSMLDIIKSALNEGKPIVDSVRLNNVGWHRDSISWRRFLFLALLVALVAATGAGSWALFFRPISVQVARLARDLPVQVFGLGTVEARVTSKSGSGYPASWSIFGRM
jgi:HlyD family secretion protein